MSTPIIPHTSATTQKVWHPELETRITAQQDKSQRPFPPSFPTTSTITQKVWQPKLETKITAQLGKQKRPFSPIIDHYIHRRTTQKVWQLGYVPT